MNEDPTYTFVKGKGWVPGIYESWVVTDYSKKRWLVVKRKPEIGELWDAVFPEYVERYIENIPQYSLSNYNPWNAQSEERFNLNGRDYLVFEPI